MTRNEFEDLAGECVTDETFEVVQFVYNFHPAISEVTGKNEIAGIYKLGGLRVLRDMYPTACKAKALEEDIRKKSSELSALRESLAELRKG